MTNVIRDSKIKRQSMKAFMNIFMYSVTAIFFAIILTSCNKPENATNPVSNDGISPDNSQLFKGPVVPIITSISPTSAEIGDLMTITGSKFGQKGNSGYFVTIKGIKATVYQSWSSTQIKVLVPSGSTTGSGNVSVTANNKKSNEVNFTLLQSSPVTIGAQTWMGSNLEVTTYRNGDPIPQVTDIAVLETMTTGAWCYYNNDPAMGAIYGKLYNWYAVNDPRGLAPIGWHIPSDAEYKTLSMALGMSQMSADSSGGYFGTTEGGKMREAGTSLWHVPNDGGTNASGFTALPAGYLGYGYMGSMPFGFYGDVNFTCWWSSTSYGLPNSATAYVRALFYDYTTTGRGNQQKQVCCSVRCVQD